MTEPTGRNPFPAPDTALREHPGVADAVDWQRPTPFAPPGPARNRSALVAVIASVVAFLAVTAVVVVMAVRGDGTTQAADPSSPISTVGDYGLKQTTPAYTTTTSVPATTSWPPVTSDLSPTPQVAAPEWRRTTGPVGISVEIPADWPVKPGAVASNVQADSTQVTGDLIRFGGNPSPARTLVASVMDSEMNTPSIRGDYQRLQLGATGAGADVVVWEFLFTAKDGTNRHAIGRFWRLGGIDYVVYASSNVDGWASMEAVFQHMVGTATPV